MPKKIKYEKDILIYDKDIQDYMGISRTGSGAFFNYLFVNKATSKFINEEVELIEEQQDIDIQEIVELVEIQTPDYREVQVGQNRAKINELIQAIKQLDNKINKE